MTELRTLEILPFNFEVLLEPVLFETCLIAFPKNLVWSEIQNSGSEHDFLEDPSAGEQY
jgi:hypothetical protein